MNLYEAVKIGKLLIRSTKTLSTAESCSGGLLSHYLTNIPGSSRYFKGGIIVYANEAKIKLLKIPPGLIKKHGAVSGPVAQHMAKAVRKIFRTDFAISITGIAGPSPSRLPCPQRGLWRLGSLAVQAPSPCRLPREGGREGGSQAKPVGLTYIAIAESGKKILSKEFHFKGTRLQIKDQAAISALKLFIHLIK